MAIVLINKTKVKWGQLGKYCFFSGSPACAKCVSEIKKNAVNEKFQSGTSVTTMWFKQSASALYSHSVGGGDISIRRCHFQDQRIHLITLQDIVLISGPHVSPCGTVPFFQTRRLGAIDVAADSRKSVWAMANKSGGPLAAYPAVSAWIRIARIFPGLTRRVWKQNKTKNKKTTTE